MDKAMLWTDGRYFLQAEKQLEKGWQLMKIDVGLPYYFEWVHDNLPKGTRIGVDTSTMSRLAYDRRLKSFGEKGVELISVPENLVDKVWGAAKPKRPEGKVFVHEVEFTGASVADKMEKVNAKLNGGCDVLLITTLDDIAWLTNLRGADIEYNPVFFSYALFYATKPGEGKPYIHLYVDTHKLSEERVQKHLKESGIQASEYLDIFKDLQKLAEEGKKIGHDENEINQ